MAPTPRTIFNLLMKSKLDDTFTISNGVQSDVCGQTWGSFFETVIKSKHWHQTSTHTTPHAESLYDHLCNCGYICYKEAMCAGYSDKDVVKAYLCGILHDIGKPGCTLEVNNNHLAAKGHGIEGGALIETYVSSDLIDNFSVYNLTSDDFSDISTCADIHMCGYFANMNNQFSITCFQMFPRSIRDMLCILRLGDQLSRIPFPGETSETSETTTGERTTDLVWSTHPKFVEDMNASVDASVLKANKLTNGVLVCMQGSSGVGKSTKAKMLSTELSRRNISNCIVNRDAKIFKWAQIHRGLHVDTTTTITTAMSKEAHDYYIAQKKVFRENVDNDIMHEITNGLCAGKIVITDTLMTGHPHAAKCILSDAAKTAFRIHIWCHRGSMFPKHEDDIGRHGMSHETQINMHGDRSIMKIFQPSVVWKDMIAITESRDSRDINIGERPHIALSWGWSGIKDKMFTGWLIDQLEHISSWNALQPRTPTIENTMNMDLPELVHVLFRHGGMDCVDFFFKQYNFRTSHPAPNVVGIKYIDGICQEWKPLWSRKARGRFYYVDDEKIVTLKDALQRGAELLTKAHIEDGVNDTQDMSTKNLDIFDDVQRDIMMKFGDGGEHGDGCDIDCVLTGKIDGSLLQNSRHPIGSDQYNVMIDITSKNPFASVLTEYCVGNNLPLHVVATQGTLMIGDQMTDYFLTSIEPFLKCSLDPLLSDIENWKVLCPEYVKLMEVLACSFPHEYLLSSIHMQFESVCKMRTTYKGQLHTELAVSYDFSSIGFLGLMFNGEYIPHFDLPKTIIPHPIHIRTTNTSTVYDVMRDLNNVVLGKIARFDFMTKWFPDNILYPIHPEGFVCLVRTDRGTGGTGAVYDYSKLKLSIYYKAHKPGNDIAPLLALPNSVDEYFPIIGHLKDFFNNVESKLVSVIYSLIIHIDTDLRIPNSKYYEMLNSGAKKHVDKYRTVGTEDTTTVATTVVVYKMIPNICRELFASQIDIETQKMWGVSGLVQRTFIGTVLTLCISCVPSTLESKTLGTSSCEECEELASKIHSLLEDNNTIKNMAYQALVPDLHAK